MTIAAAPHARVVSVEDVQSRADTRQIPINQVGIKDINHPVKVKDRSAGEQHTVANFNMYVNLPHNFKGTHMSRFVEILHREREISVESFASLLAEMTERLEADSGHIEMSFPYFVMKKAPISGVESYMDYRASLIGKRVNGETSMWVRVVVPGYQLVSLLQENLRAWRAQPALARHHFRQAARAHVDRGAHRNRRERSFMRAVWHPQTSR
jgi:GTP cyclohydrolase I